MKLLLPLLTLTLAATLPAVATAESKSAASTKSAAKPASKEETGKLGKFKVYTSIKAARKQAAEEKKPILMLFCASIYCEPCKIFESKIVDQKEFKLWAAQNVIFYVCDIKASPVPNTPESKEMFKQYQVQGYPMLVQTDAEGKVTIPRVFTRAANVEEFIKNYEMVKAAAERKAGTAPAVATK